MDGRGEKSLAKAGSTNPRAPSVVTKGGCAGVPCTFSPLVLSWRITKLDSYRPSTRNSDPVVQRLCATGMQAPRRKIGSIARLSTPPPPSGLLRLEGSA